MLEFRSRVERLRIGDSSLDLVCESSSGEGDRHLALEDRSDAYEDD